MFAGGDSVRVEVVGVFENRGGAGEDEERLPLLVLRDEAAREVRVPVGSCEGFAIHLALQEQLAPRPLTHDLAVQLLRRLSVQLEHVLIDEAEEDGWGATLHLCGPEGPVAVEARPGDAVAIAVRSGAPVYVTEALIARPPSDTP